MSVAEEAGLESGSESVNETGPGIQEETGIGTGAGRGKGKGYAIGTETEVKEEDTEDNAV